LLELVSELSGEVWSDRPAAVHPVLAAIARCVNDESTEDGRQRLVLFAPKLMGTYLAREPVSRRLVAHCTTIALDRPARKLTGWHRLPAPSLAYRFCVAPLAAADATRTVAAAAGAHKDEVLHHLLADCVAICHGEDPTTTNWWTNGASDNEASGLPGGRRGGERETGHPHR
jgi:hypothetical protein